MTRGCAAAAAVAVPRAAQGLLPPRACCCAECLLLLRGVPAVFAGLAFAGPSATARRTHAFTATHPPVAPPPPPPTPHPPQVLVTVQAADGRSIELPAAVVARDPSHELAVLLVELPVGGAGLLRPLHLASSAALRVGQDALLLAALPGGIPSVAAGALRRTTTACCFAFVLASCNQSVAVPSGVGHPPGTCRRPPHAPLSLFPPAVRSCRRGERRRPRHPRLQQPSHPRGRAGEGLCLGVGGQGRRRWTVRVSGAGSSAAFCKGLLQLTSAGGCIAAAGLVAARCTQALMSGGPAASLPCCADGCRSQRAEPGRRPSRLGRAAGGHAGGQVGPALAVAAGREGLNTSAGQYVLIRSGGRLVCMPVDRCVDLLGERAQEGYAECNVLGWQRAQRPPQVPTRACCRPMPPRAPSPSPPLPLQLRQARRLPLKRCEFRAALRPDSGGGASAHRVSQRAGAALGCPQTDSDLRRRSRCTALQSCSMPLLVLVAILLHVCI